MQAGFNTSCVQRTRYKQLFIRQAEARRQIEYEDLRQDSSETASCIPVHFEEKKNFKEKKLMDSVQCNKS